MATTTWKQYQARVIKGHRVASGLNGNPHFPGGTIRMQLPVFGQLGLNLVSFFPGTLNVSLAPLHYRVISPKMTFRNVRWHPSDPAEDFSFFDARLLLEGKGFVEGYIYHPHPDTKPKHFQDADVLELLLPWVDGLWYGKEVTLGIPAGQMVLEGIDGGFGEPALPLAE